jgi:hypothetical protein
MARPTAFKRPATRPGRRCEGKPVAEITEVVPLGQSVSWLVRYRHAWWVVYERGWLRTTDDLTEADLDMAAARLTQAEAAAARDTDLRSSHASPEAGAK